MPPSRPRKTGLICDALSSRAHDIAVELLRGRNVRVATTLASKNREWIFLSTVTVAELPFGALRSREPERTLLYSGSSALRSRSKGWTMRQPNNPGPSARTWKRVDNGSAHMTR